MSIDPPHIGRIFLDSNIIIADPHMSGINFSIFLDRLPRIAAILTLPEVVLDEVVNKFRENLSSNWTSLLNKRRDIEKMLKAGLILSREPLDITKEADKYHKSIVEQIELVGGSILEYPNILHKEIVARALQRRKPFKSDGSGYRDTLIWETIIEKLKEEGGPFAFVTADKRDFGEGPELPEHLMQDLINIGITADQIQIYPSLDALTSELLFPGLIRLDNIKEEIENQKIPNLNMQDLAMTTLDDELSNWHLETVILGAEKGTIGVDLKSVDKITNMTIDDVRQFSTGNVLVLITFMADITYEVNKAPHQKEIFDEIDSSFDDYQQILLSLDSIEGDKKGNIKVSLSVILEKDSFNVLQVEFDEIGTDKGWVGRPFNPRRRNL